MWNRESLSGLGGRERRRAAVPRMCDVRTFVLRSLLSWCLVLKWEKTMETNTPSEAWRMGPCVLFSGALEGLCQDAEWDGYLFTRR